MRRTITAAVGYLLVLVGSQIPSAFAQSDSELARQGEAILSGQCAMCHDLGRSGSSTFGNIPSFSAIAKRSDFAQLRQSLETGITSGHPAMPRISLSGTQIAAILAYLRTLRQP